MNTVISRTSPRLRATSSRSSFMLLRVATPTHATRTTSLPIIQRFSFLPSQRTLTTAPPPEPPTNGSNNTTQPRRTMLMDDETGVAEAAVAIPQQSSPPTANKPTFIPHPNGATHDANSQVVHVEATDPTTGKAVAFDVPLQDAMYNPKVPPASIEAIDPTEKLLISFVCKRCDTKLTKFIGKRSYHFGVVLIRCDGCRGLHLIADHLGWYDSQNPPGTIVDILNKKKHEQSNNKDKNHTHNHKHDHTCTSCNKPKPE